MRNIIFSSGAEGSLLIFTYVRNVIFPYDYFPFKINMLG